MLDVEGTQYDVLIKEVDYQPARQAGLMRLISRHW